MTGRGNGNDLPRLRRASGERAQARADNDRRLLRLRNEAHERLMRERQRAARLWLLAPLAVFALAVYAMGLRPVLVVLIATSVAVVLVGLYLGPPGRKETK